MLTHRARWVGVVTLFCAFPDVMRTQLAQLSAAWLTRDCKILADKDVLSGRAAGVWRAEDPFGTAPPAAPGNRANRSGTRPSRSARFT